MRNPLSAFTDASPYRRLRAWIWTTVGIVAFLGVFVAMNAVTSTRWFCNDVCHMVHADNAKAYYNASHNKISCIACHYPVGMNILTFSVDRADKLFDVMPAIQRTFEMPLNEFSRAALTMPASQCTQCHDTEVGPIRTSPGIKIDHKKHAEKGITCPTCHNRVAHQELEEMTLPGNKRHEDFMTMTACFRCHTQGDTKASEQFEATGECSACHTKEFVLKPESHLEAGWYSRKGPSKGHGEGFSEVATEVAEVSHEWDGKKVAFEEKEPRILAEVALKAQRYDESLKAHVPPAGTVNECYTCHKKKFCMDCHGVEVPHASGFAKAHSKQFKRADAAAKCAKCHDEARLKGTAALACMQCHHQQWKPAEGPWRGQHGKRIHEQKLEISKVCYKCHDERYCSACHVRGKADTDY